MSKLWPCLVLLPLLAACSNSSDPTPPPSPPPPPPANNATFQVSANRRYLMSASGAPALMVGDSAHALFVNLNSTDLETYLSNRQSHGFNILWAQALCSDYISNCRSDLSTFDGIKPFTGGSDQTNFDVTTPNPAYWSRIDNYVNAAAAHGITILFDTWETGRLMPLARLNGNAKMRNYGEFLGNRYQNFPNIVWITGNDFQTWTDNIDNTLMQNLMAGIAAQDANHLQTTQLDFYQSGSLENPLLRPLTDLAGAYDYYCSYGQTLAQYNFSPTTPVFYEEGYYEGQDFVFGNVTTPHALRTQAWWAALSGANAGQVFGSEFIYPFSGGWENHLDSTGVEHFDHLNTFLKSIAWYDLVPDQTHVVVTAGFGTADFSDNQTCIFDNDYVATAYRPDGSLAIAYAPRSSTLTLDMSRFSGPVAAQWFDPTSAAFTTLPGSPYANTGTQVFVTPGSNAGGDPDWVLLLKR